MFQITRFWTNRIRQQHRISKVGGIWADVLIEGVVFLQIIDVENLSNALDIL